MEGVLGPQKAGLRTPITPKIVGYGAENIVLSIVARV